MTLIIRILYAMENPQFCLKIPNELCQEIFNCQFELDIGNISEQMISKTIEHYSEAISFFTCQKTQNTAISKRIQFYQDKIKKLLTRKDIEKCLVGKKMNPRGIDLQHQIQKIRESAPQQAKALLQYYKAQHKNQQKLILKTMQQQNSRLSERIAQRSKSKSGYGYGQSPSKALTVNKLIINNASIQHNKVGSILSIKLF